MKKNLLFIAFAMWGATSFAQAVTGTATLTWNGVAADIASGAATGFNIYRAGVACPVTGTPSGMALQKSVAASVLTYVDAGLAAGSYCYYITATGPGGESVPSNTAGKSIFGAPSAPGALIVK